MADLYVDPNPYTGDADDEGVDYTKLMQERAAAERALWADVRELEHLAEALWAARCRHFGEPVTPCPRDERWELNLSYARAAMEAMPRHGVTHAQEPYKAEGER
jgi:hypothetical protein